MAETGAFSDVDTMQSGGTGPGLTPFQRIKAILGTQGIVATADDTGAPA